LSIAVSTTQASDIDVFAADNRRAGNLLDCIRRVAAAGPCNSRCANGVANGNGFLSFSQERGFSALDCAGADSNLLLSIRLISFLPISTFSTRLEVYPMLEKTKVCIPGGMFLILK
jgi:hypothetical protein